MLIYFYFLLPTLSLLDVNSLDGISLEGDSAAAVTVIVGSDDNDVDFSGDSPSSVFFIFDSYQDKYTYLNWYSLVFYMYS